VLTFKLKIPIWLLYKLNLNDRLVIGDKKYKISTIRVDLTDGDASCEVFTDLGLPFDSVETVLPLTVDTTDYTVDSTLLTVDATTEYTPATSYTLNEISISTYQASKGVENFEVKISSSVAWGVVPNNAWITVNKASGVRTDYIRVTVANNTSTARTGTITFTVGTDVFTLTINQDAV